MSEASVIDTVPFPQGSEASKETAASDSDLMTRIGTGDTTAFETLVDRHKGALIGYLYRLTGSHERAEDLAQESFLRLYRSTESYRESGQLTAYLFRIATNLLRSEERRSRRWRNFAPQLAASGHPLVVGDDRVEAQATRRLLRRELRDRLQRAIAELPLAFRIPLVLAEIEDWPLRRIAEVLKVREGTVKSRLFRARARLRRSLGPDFESPHLAGES